jgi:hypothetical protein
MREGEVLRRLDLINKKHAWIFSDVYPDLSIPCLVPNKAEIDNEGKGRIDI